MMKFIVLALCVAAAFARIEEWSWLDQHSPSQHRNVEDSTFRPGREYQFFYNGQLASGIPGASKQHSVNRIQALATISIKSQDKVILRLQNVRVGQMNREIPNPRKIMPFDAFEDQPYDQHLRQRLEAPVKFSYVNGMVKNVEFDTKEEPWSANVKRGILNLLQVNLQKERKIESPEESTLLNSIRGQRSSAEQGEQQPTFYRVMEQTLEGECETLYTIQHQPERRSSQPALNITKSINFEKCNKRPQVKYNFRFAAKCPTCEPNYEDDEKFLKSSTVVQYNITGTKDSFLIDMARVESQYVFTPFNEESNVIVTYVNQTLVLIKSGPIRQSQEPQSPIKSDSDMIFSLDWNIAHEKFAMHGASDSTKRLLESGAHQGANKVDLAKSLVQKMTAQMKKEQIDEEVPRKFSQLVKFLRLCDQQELEQIVLMQDFRQLSPEEEKKVKNVIPQALGACGTKDCVKVLAKKIRDGSISPVRATLALKGLLHTRVASKDIVNELIQLAESEKSRQNEHLKQSSWLAVGSLINALCAENEDQLALEIKEDAKKLCTREQKEGYVRVLFDKLRQSTKWQDKVLMLKTIGNAGLDLSIFELEKIIRQQDGQQQQPQPVYARLEAILALRELKDEMPKKIQRVLLPLAMNRREYPSIRSMASYMLLQTQPERAILDQLARSLINEPSHQYASFLYTQLETYANSTNPCEEQLATDATLALRQAKRVSTGLGYSKLSHWTFHCPENEVGLDLDAGIIYSNTSSIPRHMGVSFHTNRLGYWHKHFATLSLFTEGLEPFYRDFMQQRGSFSSQSFTNSLTEILRRAPKRNGRESESENEYERELSQLTRDLKIRHRQYRGEYENEPKAYFTAMFKSQTVSVLPIGKELIEQVIQQAPAHMSEWSQKLQRGLPIDFSTVAQLHEIQLRVPTSLGLPLSIKLEAPMAFSVKGKIQANFESIRSKSVKAQAELKPSAVVTFKTEVEAWSPIVVSGVKIQSKAKMFAPLDAKIDIEWNGQEPQIRASVKQPTQKRDLLVLESRPITFTRSWQQFIRVGDEDATSQEVTIFGEETNRVKSTRDCVEIANNQVCLNKYVQNVQGQRPKGTPFALFAGQNKLTLSVKPSQESSTQQDLQIKITGKTSTINGQEMHKPQFSILGRNSIFDETSSSSESSSEDASSQGSQELQRQTSEERRREHRRSQQHAARHPTTQSSINRRNTFQQYRDYQIKKGAKTQVEIEVQAQNTRSRLEISHIFDSKERYGKLQMKYQRQQPEQFQACFDAEMMYPENPQSIRDVQDKKILGHAQLRWGRSTCESQNFVQLTTQAERSQQQIKYERDMSEYKQYRQETRCSENKAWCSPLTQEDLLEKISHMLKYRVDIDYQNVPAKVQNYTSKLYRALKYYYYEQTDVDQLNVRNVDGKIRAEMTLDVESKQRVNVTIQTPKETMKIQDLPLSRPMFTLNQKQSFVDQMRSYVDREDEDEDVAECSVTGKNGKTRSQIDTFDGTKFTAPFTTCWSVLAKDCSSQTPEFVVMARKSEVDTNAKELKIVTRQHRIELKPDTREYDSVKVKVNGRPYDPENDQDIQEHGRTVATIDKEGQSVSVELPEVGVEVEFDGYAINVKLSQAYHGQQCGLCGHYDREEADEFRNPDFTEEKDIRQFYMNYLVKDSTCQAPRQLSDVCESEECDKESASSSSSSSSSQDEDDGDNDVYTEKPDSMTKVIEMDDQICFSMQAVLQCDDDSYASEIKEQKQVPYACFDQDSEEGEEYVRRVRYNKKSLPSMANRQPNFTRTESIPSKCQKYRS